MALADAGLTSASELCKLSALTNLTNMGRLTYDRRRTADAAAAAWSVAPLTSAIAHLTLKDMYDVLDAFQHATIQQIGYLRGLTQLEIWGGVHPLPVM